jgi:hypothetical protein
MQRINLQELQNSYDYDPLKTMQQNFTTVTVCGIWHLCPLELLGYKFNVFHVRALYYTKTVVTKKCTKRVLTSIVTHSYMFRPCWVIFRENFCYRYTKVALYS